LQQARKTGISVIMVTQSAMAETFDSQTLDNVGNVYIMTKGASKAMLRRWGLTGRWRELKDSGADISMPGTALDFHRDSLISFPMMSRPDVKRLSVVGPEKATTAPVPKQPSLQPPQQLPRQRVKTKIYSKRKPNTAEARQMRAMYKSGASKTDVTLAFYGYKDGVTFGFVRDALEDKI
jgi:hypothetical protein